MRSHFNTAENPQREAIWERLEGRTFNNLRRIVFEGSKSEFTRRIVSTLRKAPNVSRLSLDDSSFGSQGPQQPPGLPLPNLTALDLRFFSIN